MSAALFFAAVTAFVSIVAPYVGTNNFSGVILVARKGSAVVRQAYGLANVEEDVAVANDTRFAIASLSKMFTAAAVLQLRDAQKLSLDDPLSRFVPDFPRAERITIRHLLTHRSGLVQDSATPDYFELAMRSYTLQQAVDLAAKRAPSSEPGVRRQYSNSNYVLLAQVVERASGEPYADYLHRHLFAPLQMDSTTLHQSWDQLMPKRAQGYSPVGVRALYNARRYEYSIGTGAGSAWSTADDLLRWMRGLSNGRILDRSSVDEMFGLSSAEAYVGASFQAGEHKLVELTGWDGVGFASDVIWSPADDLVDIVLTNRNVPSVASDVAEDLARAVYGVPVKSLDLDETPMPPASIPILTGRYRLGSDFYVPGTTLDLVACDNGLCERQNDGRLVALLPTKSGEFIHRASWGRVRFHTADDGRATGLLFYGRFEAVRIAD